MEKAAQEDRISFKEFLVITKWSFLVMIKSSPVYSISYFVIRNILRLSDIYSNYLVAKVIDSVTKLATQSPTGGEDVVIKGVLLLFSVNGVAIVLRNMIGYASNAYRNQSAIEVRRIVYKKVNELGVQGLENSEVNDKLSRIQDLSGYVSNQFTEVTQLISFIIASAVTATLIFKLDPLIAVLALLFTIPSAAIDNIFNKKLWKFDLKNTEMNRIANASGSDLVDSKSLYEIIINGSYKFFDHKFYSIRSLNALGLRKIIRDWNIVSSVLTTAHSSVLYYGYFKAFSNIVRSTWTIGNSLFFIRNIESFQNNISNALGSLNQIYERSLRLKDSYLLLNMEPVIKDGSILLPKMKEGPKIELRNVNFTYPTGTKPVLKDINLTIKGGEKIAIIGHNGAGKTSLIKLICRMYDPSSGEILIDKQNLKSIKLSSWYQNVGVLFQEFATYSQLNVKENVQVGDTTKPFDEAAFEKALENADANKFVSELGNTYDQILSTKFKGGTNLSSGQWQKLAIARFFYRNSPLVIFDEPTASIDAVSEYNIFNKIYEFFKGKTVIIISHRFSTVRNADRIIVIENGEIVEQGTHDELLKNDGYYAKSFKLQAEGYTS